MIIIQNKYSKIPIYRLDNELKYVKVEKILDDFVSSLTKELDEMDAMDKKIKKITKNRIRNLLVVCSPFAISIFTCAVFKKPMVLQVGIALSGLGGALLILTDKSNSLKNHLKQQKEEQHHDDNIIDFYRDQNSDLVEDIPKDEKIEDYYRDSSFTEPVPEERLKYDAAAYLRKIEKYSNQNYYLDKDETMRQVTKELDTYSYVYKLPTINISNSDWDILFDEVYDMCIQHNMKEKYYNCMSWLNKMTLAKTLVYHQKKVNIYNYVNGLSYLEKKGINKDEINNLKKDIMDKLQNSNVITFPGKSK